ncbi:response regulator [Patescibacteria group bacterium]|nr:response regulator [Patescibacteria group bacterium]
MDKKRILIVEDDADIRFMLAMILGSQGAILEAGDGQEALRMIESSAPDLLITDRTMPVLDGEELVIRLRQQVKWQKLPIIMLSGDFAANTELRRRMLELKVSCLCKPCNNAVLLETVIRLLLSVG